MKSNSSITGTTSNSFNIGKLTIESDGDFVYLSYPNKNTLQIPLNGNITGTQWYVISGPPDFNTGKLNDLCFNPIDNSIRRKNSIGDWDFVATISGGKGDKGDRGAPGETIGTGIDGSFETVDGKRVSFSNGVITSITDIE